jgi:hypothetical protein
MKITMGIKESKDKYGHVIDFILCFICITFVHIDDYEIVMMINVLNVIETIR